MGNGEPERKRCERHIVAADIQQPGNRSRVAEDGRVLLRLAQQSGDLLALLVGRAAREFQRMRFGRCLGWGWPVGPDEVDRIGLYRLHGQARVCEARQALLGEQPRVVADLRASRSVGGQPASRRFLGHMPALPQIRVGLLRELKHVAAVGEHGRLVLEHDRDPGTPGEACQPCQPFGCRRHVFTEMLIGARHNEAVKGLAPQLLAQFYEPLIGFRCHITPRYLELCTFS